MLEGAWLGRNDLTHFLTKIHQTSCLFKLANGLTPPGTINRIDSSIDSAIFAGANHHLYLLALW